MNPIRESTEDARNSEETKPEFTTCIIRKNALQSLKDMRIAPREPPYSVIDRLLEEHDLKTMRKVVLKRVR